MTFEEWFDTETMFYTRSYVHTLNEYKDFMESAYNAGISEGYHKAAQQAREDAGGPR